MSNPGDSLKPAGAAARDARPEGFPHAATAALANPQVRANIRHATTTIRAKRAAVVAEVPDWELLRAAGAAIKDEALTRLDEVLVDRRARGLDHEDVGAANVLVDLERDFRVRKTQQPRLAELHAEELANLGGERPMGASRKQF